MYFDAFNGKFTFEEDKIDKDYKFIVINLQ